MPKVETNKITQLEAELEETYRSITVLTNDLELTKEDLYRALEQAEAANRAKSEFLANMSHELRTPLNAIIGFSEIIKNESFGPVGSTQYRGFADDIHAAGQHLLALINDILDISKVESGTNELCDEIIEVPMAIRSVLKLANPRAVNGGVELGLDIRNDLPLLRADERKLKQILLNLLANAIKFTDPDGQVTIRAWCRADSGFVFQVVDTGIGIAPNDVPRALARFGQIDGGLNRKYDGTGLGLPLSKSLVELHGGSLDVQSQLGAGTTVTVRFPAARIIPSQHGTDLHGADRESGRDHNGQILGGTPVGEARSRGGRGR